MRDIGGERRRGFSHIKEDNLAEVGVIGLEGSDVCEVMEEGSMVTRMWGHQLRAREE